MKIQNRVLSFIIVSIVYLLAITLGIIIYNVLDFENVYVKLLIADVSATIFTFIFSLLFKNASVYDPYWSVQPLVITICFLISNISLSGIIVTILIWFWGVRLTANWAYTFKGLTHQDWRYTMLSEKTGVFYPFVNFLGIHMFPTLVVYACCLPAVYIIINRLPFNVLGVIGIIISLSAVFLQTVSDIQMQSFRNKKQGGFIRYGLWKYSRHPNYLGEILMWWGIALFMIALKISCWYLIAGAIINNFMFLVISIPMADKRQSKKEGFIEYKKSTRMLLPVKKIISH